MKRIFKKAFLLVSLALLIPAQSHGFSQRFTQAFASSLAWAKSSCGYALACLGVLATTAFVADYVSNKQELDMLTDIRAQLDGQRKNKKLKRIEVLDKSLRHRCFSDLRERIKNYNSLISKHTELAELIFDTYENDLVIKQHSFLIEYRDRLNNEREQLLGDPRCKMEIVSPDQRSERSQRISWTHRAPLKEMLKHYLPTPIEHEQMALEGADKAIEGLEKHIKDCRTHVKGLIYKNLKLDETVHAYLIKLLAHAQALKENIEKINETKAAVDKHGFQFNNSYQDVAVYYADLHKHIEKLILERQQKRAQYRSRGWKACGMAAIAAASYALIRHAWKGN